MEALFDYIHDNNIYRKCINNCLEKIKLQTPEKNNLPIREKNTHIENENISLDFGKNIVNKSLSKQNKSFDINKNIALVPEKENNCFSIRKNIEKEEKKDVKKLCKINK